MTPYCWITIKFTLSEGRRIERLAKEAGVTRHAYLRNIIRAALAAQKESKT